MVIILGESKYNKVNPKLSVLLKDVPGNIIIRKSVSALEETDFQLLKSRPLLFKYYVLVTTYDSRFMYNFQKLNHENLLIIVQCDNYGSFEEACRKLEYTSPKVFNNFKVPREVKQFYTKQALRCTDEVAEYVVKQSGSSLYLLNKNIDYLKSIRRITPSILKTIYSENDVTLHDFPMLLCKHDLTKQESAGLLKFLKANRQYHLTAMLETFNEFYNICTLVSLGEINYSNYSELDTTFFKKEVYNILELVECTSMDSITEVWLFMNTLKPDKSSYIRLLLFIKERTNGRIKN